MNARAFPYRLRTARRIAGLSQRQVARSIHYSHETSVSQWELGKHTPNEQTVRLLAGVLHVEFDWLSDGAGPMRNQARRVLG